MMHRSSSLIRVACRSRSNRVISCTRQTRPFVTRASRVLTIRCSHGFPKKPSLAKFPEVQLWQQVAAYSSDADLPEHYKVPLPALSPTMEQGTLVRWSKLEGDELSEGDLLAEIETDKATMGFETPEEGYLAKILIPDGTKDVPIGKLLCIIVHKLEDVAAFADFKAPEGDISYSPPVAPSTPDSTTSAPPSGSSEPASMSTPKNYPKHITVTLPALSPTMEKGNITDWVAQEGTALSEGDVLVQIETDKATMDFETPEEGYLAKILIPSGTKDVPLGQMLCVLVENEADVAAFKDYTAPAADSAAPAATPVAPSPAAPTHVRPTAPAPQQVTAPAPSGGRIVSSPYAKKLAEERGIDLSLVAGSGPDGRIVATDVENYIPSASPPPSIKPVAMTTPPAGALYTDIPLTNMRKIIAQRLLESKTTIPHYYLTVDVEMDNIIKLRKELNELLLKEKVKISVNDFIIKAAALSCRKVPAANSSWQETFVREHHTVDMCVAVATDEGLITPIVTQAEKKGLATICQEVQELAAKARSKSLQPHEFQGGTFTISNLGMFGIKHFSAVINPPQACILAIGGAQKTIVVDSDHERGYRSASVMTVTLSCDHRVVDGAVGAQWLQHFKSYMEKPQSMLL